VTRESEIEEMTEYSVVLIQEGPAASGCSMQLSKGSGTCQDDISSHTSVDEHLGVC